MARPRSICFTLNNYTAEELAFINLNVQNGSFKYIVFQQERGANGTAHLQGYAQRPNPTTLAGWKAVLSVRVHIEASRGTAQQNREYCTKDTDRIPGTLIVEKGEIPAPGARDGLNALVEAAKDPSVPLSQLIDDHGVDYLRYHKGISAIRSALAPPRDFKTQIFWFYGSTGSGKTRAMHEIAPGAYWKQNSPWWCGYDPCTHSDVCIDEYRGDFSKFTFLLSLFDRYPLQVQCKGGNINFRARRIFITSPRDPKTTWESRNDEDLQQLYRRIECIVEFLPGGAKRVVKGNGEHNAILGIVPLVVGDIRDPEAAPEEEDVPPQALPQEPRRVRARVDEFNE